MKELYYSLFMLCLMQTGYAQNIKPYSLFNPVPKHLLRSMSTDRPDITESPISVDAGHFQLETDLFKTIRNKTAVENNFNLANLKLGMLQNADIQLVIGSFVHNYSKDDKGNKLNPTSGFGDITLRVKYNLWGNNNEKTALALMPYVNFPTSKTSTAIEGGMVLPFSLSLNNGFSTGTQLQFDLLKSTQKKGYHAQVLQSLVIGKELNKALETFTESYYVYDFELKKFDLSFNGGFAFMVSENLKFDTGFNLGITKNADNVYFIGFSFRY